MSLLVTIRGGTERNLGDVVFAFLRQEHAQYVSPFIYANCGFHLIIFIELSSLRDYVSNGKSERRRKIHVDAIAQEACTKK